MALILQRPPTAKPRDPESYEFNDEQLERDYRKMYEKYQEMEAVLKEKPELESVPNEDIEGENNNEEHGQDGLYKWWKKT